MQWADKLILKPAWEAIGNDFHGTYSHSIDT